MISVLIATRNRPKQLIRCLESIQKNRYPSYEIIIADQSAQSDPVLQQFLQKHPSIRYIPMNSTGKSKALNAVIPEAKGDIIAFTDDDCIASPSWLTSIEYFFRTHQKVAGVFGKVLPHLPLRHKNMFCPCTFTKNEGQIITKPLYHAEHIGFGNNMAFRKKVLLKTPGFQEWLGPGSIGLAANDAGITLYLLVKGVTLAYEPTILISHNRWMTTNEMNRQMLRYEAGEMACYGYFHFQGHRFAGPIVFGNIRDSFNKIKRLLKNVILLRWSEKLLIDAYYSGEQIIWRARGLVIGFFFSLLDPIR